MSTQDKLYGSWRLLRTFKTVDGEITDRFPLGQSPYGYIHYVPDGRVSVLIAYDGRKPVRDPSSDAEVAANARKFVAYGGTFTVERDDFVVHHLDITTLENDRGTDYPRTMEFEGNTLTLGTPVVETPEGRIGMKLVWEKVAG
jgi:hypothetical protein